MILTGELAVIVAAALAALGPTIASIGAWRLAKQTNKAVNDRPPEAPTISDDVAATRVRLEIVGDQVKVLRGRLDEHLTGHDVRPARGPRWR